MALQSARQTVHNGTIGFHYFCGRAEWARLCARDFWITEQTKRHAVCLPSDYCLPVKQTFLMGAAKLVDLRALYT